MELLADEIAKVDYNKNTGILRLDIPYFNPTIMHQSVEQFTILLDQINQLQVKRLLVNTSQIINKPSATDYKNLMGYFYSGLEQTGLQKLASIQRNTSGCEAYFFKLNSELREEMGLSFAFQNFETMEAAEIWLLS